MPPFWRSSLAPASPAPPSPRIGAEIAITGQNGIATTIAIATGTAIETAASGESAVSAKSDSDANEKSESASDVRGSDASAGSDLTDTIGIGIEIEIEIEIGTAGAGELVTPEMVPVRGNHLQIHFPSCIFFQAARYLAAFGFFSSHFGSWSEFARLRMARATMRSTLAMLS